MRPSLANSPTRCEISLQFAADDETAPSPGEPGARAGQFAHAIVDPKRKRGKSRPQASDCRAVFARRIRSRRDRRCTAFRKGTATAGRSRRRRDHSSAKAAVSIGRYWSRWPSRARTTAPCLRSMTGMISTVVFPGLTSMQGDRHGVSARIAHSSTTEFSP